MKKLILSILLLFPFILFSQGKLDKAKENLSENNSKSNSSISENHLKSRIHHRNRNNNGFILAIFEDLAFYTFYGAFIGNSEYRTFTPYPYFKNLKGEYLKIDTIYSKKNLFKLSANRLFNSSINAIEINANYRVLPILGIEVSHLNFSESTLSGQNQLGISSFMLKYYRVREQPVSIWWGMGASYVGNGVDTWGFAYTIGAEIFPVEPISFFTSFKQSFINYSNINEFKFHLKYHIDKIAVFTGYQANSLGGENVNGLVFGAEYTF